MKFHCCLLLKLTNVCRQKNVALIPVAIIKRSWGELTTTKAFLELKASLRKCLEQFKHCNTTKMSLFLARHRSHQSFLWEIRLSKNAITPPPCNWIKRPPQLIKGCINFPITENNDVGRERRSTAEQDMSNFHSRSSTFLVLNKWLSKNKIMIWSNNIFPEESVMHYWVSFRRAAFVWTEPG